MGAVAGGRLSRRARRAPCALACALALAGGVAPAAASWDLTVNGRVAFGKTAPPPAAPDGAIAVLTGTLGDGDLFRAVCTEAGKVAFSYVQSGKWLPVLAEVAFTLTVHADGGHPVPITTRPRNAGDGFVAYENDHDQAAVGAVLQNFVNAIRTIELDVEANTYGVKWTNVASAKNSTVTTQRFARACGVGLLPFGRYPPKAATAGGEAAASGGAASGSAGAGGGPGRGDPSGGR